MNKIEKPNGIRRRDFLKAGAAGPHSVIDQLDISAEDRDLILRGNLRRLFKL